MSYTATVERKHTSDKGQRVTTSYRKAFFEAAAEVERLRMSQPKWTRDKPTKAGWYWQRTTPSADMSAWAVKVRLGVNGLHVGGTPVVNLNASEWAGPLEPPT